MSTYWFLLGRDESHVYIARVSRNLGSEVTVRTVLNRWFFSHHGCTGVRETLKGDVPHSVLEWEATDKAQKKLIVLRAERSQDGKGVRPGSPLEEIYGT